MRLLDEDINASQIRTEDPDNKNPEGFLIHFYLTWLVNSRD